MKSRAFAVEGFALAVSISGIVLADTPVELLDRDSGNSVPQFSSAPQSESLNILTTHSSQPLIGTLSESPQKIGEREILTQWTSLQGKVWDNSGSIPLCALVLANGQFIFSCDTSNPGRYSLNVPLDSNGQITLFSFVDGLPPYKVLLSGNTSVWDIKMGAKCSSGPVCGNGVCETGETASSCPQDCYRPVCGNGVCETGETASSCPQDCYVPPSQTTITLGIKDSCYDGYRIEWRYFDVTNNLVWPSSSQVYYNQYEGQWYTNNLLCNVGAKVCYGARTGNSYWGIDVDGSKSCSSCCVTCQSGLQYSWNLTCN